LALISEGLKQNSSLVTLYINDNDIGDEGAVALLKALDSNCTLRHVILDCNIIEDRSLLGQIQQKLYNNKMYTKNPVVTPQIDAMDYQRSKEIMEEEKTKSLKISQALEAEKAHNTKLKTQINMLTVAKKDLNAKVSALEEELATARSAISSLEQKFTTLDLSQKEKEAKHQQALKLLRKQLLTAEQTNKLQQQQFTELSEKYKYVEKRGKEISGEGLDEYDMQQLTFLEVEFNASLLRIRNLKVQKLQRKVKELEDGKKCIVCYDSKINIVLVPCGHHILCEDCSEKITKCPICSAQIQMAVKTFYG